MKRLMFGFGLMFLTGAIYAAGALVVESPINGYGTPVTIAISSTTLTKVPSSQTSGRVGIFISNPASNPVTPMAGFLGNCTSTALANTIRPIEIATSSSTTTNRYFSMREDVCLWLLSLDTTASTRNVHYQEVKQ